MTSHTAREKILWTIAILVVVFYALLPVLWILSLSLKDPATIARRALPPAGLVARRTTRSSSRPSDFTYALRQLDRHRRDRDADLDLPRLDGRLRDRAAAVSRQGP